MVLVAVITDGAEVIVCALGTLPPGTRSNRRNVAERKINLKIYVASYLIPKMGCCLHVSHIVPSCLVPVGALSSTLRSKAPLHL